MKVRRVVTGNSGSKSVFVSDGPAPRSRDFASIPGQSSTLIWSTPGEPAVPHDGVDAITDKSTYLPRPAETRLMVVTFAPDSTMMSASFDPAAAGRELMEELPDLAATFEPDNPGMHTTDTVDYGIVLEGEIWLELDDGKEVHLKAHDVVIQNGTRHAWRNKTDKPVKMAFVLIGARRRT
jgi:mannose-6-phosphate isomerase-like protein (cupin superfamily)